MIIDTIQHLKIIFLVIPLFGSAREQTRLRGVSRVRYNCAKGSWQKGAATVADTVCPMGVASVPNADIRPR